MSSTRRAAVLPLAAALAGVLLAAAPAYATVRATWSKPTDNSTFTSYTPIEILVTLDRGSSLTADGAAVNLNLAVPGPTPGPHRVDTSSGTGDRDLKFTFTPACPNHAGACGGSAAPAYNGRYTVSLSGAVTGSRTVVLQVPPAAPSGVTATAVGERRVRIAWSPNAEPDLTGYDVFTDEGVTVAANLSKDTTAHEFELPSSGYGGEHSFVVRAQRLACANCSGPEAGAQIPSAMSQPASVTFNEPTPEPSPDGGGDPSTDPGTGGGGNGGGSGGNGGGTGGDDGYNGDGGDGNGTGGNGGGTPGPGGGSPTPDNGGYNSGNAGGEFSSGKTQDEQTRATQRKLAFGLTFKSFAPKLGAPKLPPLPQFAPPTQEIPWGSYDPTLNYGDQTVIDSEKIAQGGGITSTIVDSMSTVFEGRRFFSSIAMALLLLLAAAHVRVWLRTTPTA